MRSAGEQIRGNQLGQAVQQQGRVQEGLREIADLVAGRQPRKPAEQPTAQAGQSLEEIKRTQEEINRRTQELEKSLKPAERISPEARRRYEALSREQAKLGEVLRKLFGPPPPEEPKP
jgi:chromosome segregation ATPase